MKHVTLRWLRALAAVAAAASLSTAGIVRASGCERRKPMPCCQAPGMSSSMACCAMRVREAQSPMATAPTGEKSIIFFAQATSLATDAGYDAKIRRVAPVVFVSLRVPSTVLRI